VAKAAELPGRTKLRGVAHVWWLGNASEHVCMAGNRKHVCGGKYEVPSVQSTA